MYELQMSMYGTNEMKWNIMAAQALTVALQWQCVSLLPVWFHDDVSAFFFFVCELWIATFFLQLAVSGPQSDI